MGEEKKELRPISEGTRRELIHAIVERQMAAAYREAQLDAINTILYDIDETRRYGSADEPPIMPEVVELVGRLRQAQAKVRRRWEEELDYDPWLAYTLPRDEE